MQFPAGPAYPKHEQIVNSLREQIIKRNTYGDRKVEVKQFEVSHCPGLTFLLIEVGSVGDEGTAAAIFCRDYRHIAITKRGGITLLNAKHKSYSHGRWNAVHQLTR